MAKRRKEDALETRERILDAAITVFHEHGVARPSLTEIAELAGVTRGAVYGHFRNKADLFGALAERVRLPGETLGDASSREIHGDPLAALRARWLALFREVAGNPQWQAILEIIFFRCELVTESGEIRERMLQGHAQGIARVAQMLRLAVDAGQLPADLDLELATTFIHGSLVGLMQDWLLRPADYDLPDAGTRAVDALLAALRGSPALRLATR